MGVWRDHLLSPTQKGKSTIHLVTASNWKDNTTYVLDHSDLLFGDNGLQVALNYTANSQS